MADFEKAIPIILKHEGGYVDHPADPGGATNRGIIFSLFKQYAFALGLEKTKDALKTLTEDQAKFIYREHFWDKMRGDDIQNQQIANIVFDGFVNMGPRALRMFQTQLGLKADGIVGDKTILVANNTAGGVLFEQFKEARIRYYQNLATKKPQMQVFLNGWLNRINSFKYEYA